MALRALDVNMYPSLKHKVVGGDVEFLLPYCWSNTYGLGSDAKMHVQPLVYLFYNVRF